MTALAGARYSRLRSERIANTRAHDTKEDVMITQARRQQIQRRLSRARTLVGRFAIPRHVWGEFLGVVLFGYALPLVWAIGIVGAYLGHAR